MCNLKEESIYNQMKIEEEREQTGKNDHQPQIY